MVSANSSYVFGTDAVGGWGPRYFYTFYSEFGERRGAAEAEITVLFLTFLLSIVLNVMIAFAVLRYREMRTVTNCFLLNLTAADLVFATGIPMVAMTRLTQEWVLGDVACRLLPYSQFVCGFVLLWTLTLISMDRHRCIVVPPYRSQLTPRLAAALTIGTWLVATVLFLPVVYWFRQQTADNKVIVCTLIFPKTEKVNLSLCFTIPVLLLACLLPMGLLVYHYQRIFQKLVKTRSKWLGSSQVEDVLPGRRKSSLSVVGNVITPWSKKQGPQIGLGPQHEEIRLAKHIRVIRVLLLNVVAVLVMWLPITILMFLIYLDGSRPNEDTGFFLRSHHFIWALLVALLNTIVNPLLYGVLSENFRSCFIKLWFGSNKKRKNNRLYANALKTNPSRSNNETVLRYPENASSNPSSSRWNEINSVMQAKIGFVTHPI